MKVFKILVFDLEFLRLSCVGIASPLRIYLGKVSLILATITVMLIVHCVFVVARYRGIKILVRLHEVHQLGAPCHLCLHGGGLSSWNPLPLPNLLAGVRRGHGCTSMCTIFTPDVRCSAAFAVFQKHACSKMARRTQSHSVQSVGLCERDWEKTTSGRRHV